MWQTSDRLTSSKKPVRVQVSWGADKEAGEPPPGLTRGCWMAREAHGPQGDVSAHSRSGAVETENFQSKPTLCCTLQTDTELESSRNLIFV